MQLPKYQISEQTNSVEDNPISPTFDKTRKQRVLAASASLVVQLVKNPPAMQETWVQSLGWEDPLGEGKWPPTPVFWPGEFHGLHSPWGYKELDTTERLSLHFTSF